ncbi:hypothetical protein DL768_010482 [Monosporascus sp. mg162]|nr:hypothetical protein DL768_010482 [Monosporascus sp. mg162]
MANVICQALTKAQQPIMGMRVRLSYAGSAFAYEGFTSPSGLVDHWTQLSPNHYSRREDLDGLTNCRFEVAMAEYFGADNVPWPIIQIDLKLPEHLQHYLLLCCDVRSYNISTTAIGPPSQQPPTIIRSPRSHPRTRVYPAQEKVAEITQHSSSLSPCRIPPTPSPMEDVQFDIQSVATSNRRRRRGAQRKSDARKSRGGKYRRGRANNGRL